MKSSRYGIAAIIFSLPIFITLTWFYSGMPKLNNSAIPDFSSIDLSQPPLSTAIALPEIPKTSSTSVLIDMKHGNLIALTEIDPLLRNVEARGGSIEVFREDGDLATKLKTASAFISPIPMSSFSAEEMQSILSFVERGGRLVVVTDPTRNTFYSESGSLGLSGVDAANLLLEPFDLSFRDDYLYDMVNNEGNYRNIILTNFSNDVLMEDIKQLVIYGGHSLSANGLSLATAEKGTISSTDEQSGDLSPMKIAAYHKGMVVAIGDISLMTGQYIQSADNQIFVRNLARFLTETNREITLAEFPFIFKEKVVIHPIGKLKIDGELISAISNLEKVMGNKVGSLTISQDTDTKTDRILLTTFETSEETKGLLESLQIDLSPDPTEKEKSKESGDLTPQPTATLTPTPTFTPTPSSTPEETPDVFEPDIPLFENENPPENPKEILVPGMGIVETDGLGVIGLVHENDRYTLVIMASSAEKIQELLNQLSTENLKNCLIHKNLAACRISGSSIEPVG